MVDTHMAVHVTVILLGVGCNLLVAFRAPPIPVWGEPVELFCGAVHEHQMMFMLDSDLRALAFIPLNLQITQLQPRRSPWNVLVICKLTFALQMSNPAVLLAGLRLLLLRAYYTPNFKVPDRHLFIGRDKPAIWNVTGTGSGIGTVR